MNSLKDELEKLDLQIESFRQLVLDEQRLGIASDDSERSLNRLELAKLALLLEENFERA